MSVLSSSSISFSLKELAHFWSQKQKALNSSSKVVHGSIMDNLNIILVTFARVSLVACLAG
jgi:hypothetical protein